MYAAASSLPVVNSPRAASITGRAISTIAVAFLTFDAVAKLLLARQVIEATAQLGIPVGTIPLIGALLLVSTIVYAVPQTAVIGATLLTGYLGGAIAVQLRVGNPLFETTFPVIMAALIWGGLLLRDRRLLPLLRLRRDGAAV